MIFLLFLPISSYLYAFEKQNISAGTVFERFFETSQADLVINLQVLNCAPPCQIEVAAFEELRRRTMLTNVTNYQARCCALDSTCDKNQLHFSKNAAVLRRVIPFTNPEDVVLDKDDVLNSKTNKIEKSSAKIVRIPSKTLWSIIVANCGNSNLQLDGTISVRRPRGYLDDRLNTFTIVSVAQVVSGLFFIILYILTAYETVPKLTVTHKILLAGGALFALDGFFKIVLFYQWNQSDCPPLYASFLSAIFRSFFYCEVLYLSIAGLQYPQEVPWKLFALVSIPFLLFNLFDNSGIIGFNKRLSGRWTFGFSPYLSLEFLASVFFAIGITLYAQIYKPSETSHNEKHHTFLALFASIFSGFFVSCFLLFIWRFGKSAIQTRKSEWVPFSLLPVYYFLLLVANSWYWLEFNPSGWQTLDNQTEAFIKIGEDDAHQFTRHKGDAPFSPFGEMNNHVDSIDPFAGKDFEEKNEEHKFENLV